MFGAVQVSLALGGSLWKEAYGLLVSVQVSVLVKQGKTYISFG